MLASIKKIYEKMSEKVVLDPVLTGSKGGFRTQAIRALIVSDFGSYTLTVRMSLQSLISQ